VQNGRLRIARVDHAPEEGVPDELRPRSIAIVRRRNAQQGNEHRHRTWHRSAECSTLEQMSGWTASVSSGSSRPGSDARFMNEHRSRAGKPAETDCWNATAMGVAPTRLTFGMVADARSTRRTIEQTSAEAVTRSDGKGVNWDASKTEKLST
jgi:hypothetical protein